MRLILAAAVLAMFTAPAFAEGFYIVQDTATKKCTVVTEKPTVTSMVVVGNTVYKTKTEAETGLKTTTVCVSK